MKDREGGISQSLLRMRILLLQNVMGSTVTDGGQPVDQDQCFVIPRRSATNPPPERMKGFLAEVGAGGTNSLGLTDCDRWQLLRLCCCAHFRFILKLNNSTVITDHLETHLKSSCSIDRRICGALFGLRRNFRN